MSEEQLDGEYNPFNNYAGYSLMAPCMRSCEDYLPFNGCDNSACWCKKNNLDRRISQLERCASTSCTFADMNTKTDVDMLSAIQLQYCIDRDFSPSGMTMPSTIEAQTTSADSGSSPSETGGALSTAGSNTGAGTTSRTRPSSGPSNTGALSSTSSTPTTLPPSPSNSSSADSTTSSNSSNSSSNSSLSTAAKAGIAIGAVFCILLAILIAILLLRRRKRAQYPPSYATHAQPQMTAGPSPYAAPAPPLQVQTTGATGFAASKPDVSPIEEKTPAFAHTAVSRKEVGTGVASPNALGTPHTAHATPVPQGSPGQTPMEIAGSMPPDRHEVHSESTTAVYQSGPDGGQGRWVYEVSGQQGGGAGRDGAYELGTGGF